MAYAEPFTFGVALVPRATARDWPLVEALLGLTLASVRAQTDPDFAVLVLGHDRPATLPDDPRVEFLESSWPVEPPGPHNADSGRKKHALNDLVLERGGGLFMVLDADDWVDRRLVEAARATPREAVGAIVDTGLITDLRTLRAAPLPHPRIFAGEFHRLCGSSGVARLRPDHPDPLRRDPFSVLRSHHQWLEVAAAHDVQLARLPVPGNYLINTSENHSEVHGPHLDWRRGLTAAVNREGAPLDERTAGRFGLRLEQVRAVSGRFLAGPRASLDGPARRG